MIVERRGWIKWSEWIFNQRKLGGNIKDDKSVQYTETTSGRSL